MGSDTSRHTKNTAAKLKRKLGVVRKGIVEPPMGNPICIKDCDDIVKRSRRITRVGAEPRTAPTFAYLAWRLIRICDRELREELQSAPQQSIDGAGVTIELPSRRRLLQADTTRDNIGAGVTLRPHGGARGPAKQSKLTHVRQRVR